MAVDDKSAQAQPAVRAGVTAPAAEGISLTDEQCCLLLEERGIDVPRWPHRLLLAILFLIATASLCGAAAFLFGVWGSVGLVAVFTASLVALTYMIPRTAVVTDTARTGTWPERLRHLNRWIPLAGPRLLVASVALLFALVAIAVGIEDRGSFTESFYAGIAGSLIVIAGAALLAVFWEYRQQLRVLRRNTEPTIIALQLGEQVSVADVAQLMLSLTTGVATAGTNPIGIIGADRARSAIAIYAHTQSPTAIAPVIETACIRLGFRKASFEQDNEHLAKRHPTGLDELKDRNLATTFLGHQRATEGTRSLVFSWMASNGDTKLYPRDLHASLMPTGK